MNQRTDARRKITLQQEKRLVARSLQGYTVSALAKEFDLTEGGVRLVIRRNTKTKKREA